jgi:inorganic triphosphatase YgiF
MVVSREVELKLELPIAEAARLLERSFNRLEGKQGIKQHLVSTYFDTDEHALRQHGLTLRIRSGGKRQVQTIKAIDTASACIFDRLEWETEIKGDKPDLIAAARTPVGDVLHGSRASKLLAPIFKTVVDRTTWNVKQGGSEIEVALDEGRVSARRSTRPIAELELELKRGSPTDLFALARSLDCVKDLEIGVLSKSERGYALADGDEPRSFKAEPIALEPNLSTAEAFQNIARACIRHFRLNEPFLIARRSAEPLHQARVAIRRLRSALSSFEPVVTDQKYERLKSRLCDVSHQLGEARNLDVYIAYAKVPDVDKGGQLPPLTLKPVGQAQAERERAYERVINTLQSKRFRHFMQDLVAWIQAGPWRTSDKPESQTARDQNIEDYASYVLKRRRRKFKRHGRHLERLSPEERHRIRIEAKNLRYAAEFFSELFSGRKHRNRYQEFIAALGNLQARLGDLNDIQNEQKIAAELVSHKSISARRSPARHAAAGEFGNQDKRTTALLISACEAHQQFLDAKPFWK